MDDNIPVNVFDLTVDWIATEKGLIETKSPYPKPTGIVWEEVSEEDMETMPVLKEIKELISNK
ncbi:hypothetical protein ACFW35_17585 [Fictibacillus sp. NPDC058756]|uniref:hypothetical protein n=1 Tax=Fictibacillus sp. NPDC058756 TaxID=3346625 RepID=UPI0036C98415